MPIITVVILVHSGQGKTRQDKTRQDKTRQDEIYILLQKAVSEESYSSDSIMSYLI